MTDRCKKVLNLSHRLLVHLINFLEVHKQFLFSPFKLLGFSVLLDNLLDFRAHLFIVLVAHVVNLLADNALFDIAQPVLHILDNLDLGLFFGQDKRLFLLCLLALLRELLTHELRLLTFDFFAFLCGEGGTEYRSTRETVLTSSLIATPNDILFLLESLITHALNRLLELALFHFVDNDQLCLSLSVFNDSLSASFLFSEQVHAVLQRLAFILDLES